MAVQTNHFRGGAKLTGTKATELAALLAGVQALAEVVTVVSGTPRLPTFTVAGLPAAAAGNIGSLAYVSDASGGATVAYSNGTNWLKVHDNLAV